MKRGVRVAEGSHWYELVLSAAIEEGKWGGIEGKLTLTQKRGGDSARLRVASR